MVTDSGVWNKAPRQHDKNSSVHVEEDRIQLDLRHFCKQTASAKSSKTLDLLVYQNPKSLENEQLKDAYITVYAIPRSSKKVDLKVKSPINIKHKYKVKELRHVRYTTCPYNMLSFMPSLIH